MALQKLHFIHHAKQFLVMLLSERLYIYPTRIIPQTFIRFLAVNISSAMPTHLHKVGIFLFLDHKDYLHNKLCFYEKQSKHFLYSLFY